MEQTEVDYPFMVPHPLYRLWSSAIGDHFYTTSANERNSVTQKYGYVDEGVACYVYTQKI